MAYITPAELAERPGARELAQLASAEHQVVSDYALMDATLRGTSRAAWTLEQTTAADAALARINDAVAEAGGVIDGYLVQRGYALPLDLPATSTGKSVLAAWARAITRYLLNKSRITDETKDPVARDYRDALKMLGLLAMGKYSLGAGDPASSSTASSNTDVRFTGAATVFGRDQMSSFR
jgi:phage gp36-like protein